MRRKKKQNRPFEPDIKYKSTIVTKFINYVMRKGKKEVARKVVYNTFDLINKDQGKEPLTVFELAIKNISPDLEIRSKRIGGANYQVPVEVKADRKLILSLRWLIKAAKSKKGTPISKGLAEEIMAAAKNEGIAIKKKLDTHRMAEANRAFAHFAR